MQKENTLTVEQWCGQWFTANRHKWNGNTTARLSYYLSACYRLLLANEQYHRKQEIATGKNGIFAK